MVRQPSIDAKKAEHVGAKNSREEEYEQDNAMGRCLA